MNPKAEYRFSAKPWQHAPPGGWYFVSIPGSLSREIRAQFGWQEEGWGRLKTRAKIRDVEWNSSLWFDTRQEAYLLPLKADIRRKAKIEPGKSVSVIVWV